VPEHAHSSWRKAVESGPGSLNATTRSYPERNNIKNHPAAPIVPTVADLMSRDLDFCTPDRSVQAIARMMADRNVGSIPVVNDTDHMVPIGILTDRDIVIRVVAPGLDPCSVRADQFMSLEIQTIRSNVPVSEAIALMQRHQLRRLPVVDDTGCLVGILSHADVIRPANAAQNAETIRELSEPVS
jgi:CBS domain-containing protein